MKILNGTERENAINKLIDLGFERDWHNNTIRNELSLNYADKKPLDAEIIGTEILLNYVDKVSNGIKQGITVEEFTNLVSHTDSAHSFFLLPDAEQTKEAISLCLADSDYHRKFIPQKETEDTFDPDGPRIEESDDDNHTPGL